MKNNAKKLLAALNVTTLIMSGSLPVMAGDKPAAAEPKAAIVRPAGQPALNSGNLQNLDQKEAVKNKIPQTREKVGAGFCGAGKCGGGKCGESLKNADVPHPDTIK